jgi:hypothetical protein
MKNGSLTSLPPAEDLIDIHNISIDMNLPKAERLQEYIRQIRNPYRFRCGKYIINVTFQQNGPSFEDCLRSLAE